MRRIAFGAKMAALRVAILDAGAEAGGALRVGHYVSLANLRRGRGQARRVVLLCAPEGIYIYIHVCVLRSILYIERSLLLLCAPEGIHTHTHTCMYYVVDYI